MSSFQFCDFAFLCGSEIKSRIFAKLHWVRVITEYNLKKAETVFRLCGNHNSPSLSRKPCQLYNMQALICGIDFFLICCKNIALIDLRQFEKEQF